MTKTEANREIRGIMMTGVALLVGCVLMAKANGKSVPTALPADTVVHAIHTAVAAKPGEIVEIEAELEGGKKNCDVIILAEDGKRYEAIVNALTGELSSLRIHEEDGDEEPGATLPVEVVIQAIKSAAQSKPGGVLEVEAEDENGKSSVTVEILAEDGRTYEVEVEAATGKVLNTKEEKPENEEEEN